MSGTNYYILIFIFKDLYLEFTIYKLKKFLSFLFLLFNHFLLYNKLLHNYL